MLNIFMLGVPLVHASQRYDHLADYNVECLILFAGIVGLTAACLGAHVMLTDTREVLPSIWENVEANKELIEAAGGSATVVELDWNEPDADPDVLEQDYDWIFGSDITYDENVMPILARLYRQIVLTNERAVIKIAHHHRSKEMDKAMRVAFAGEASCARFVLGIG
jgi:hypothetical protein